MTDRRPPDENSTNLRCCLAATSGDIQEEFKLDNIHNDSTAETGQNTRTPQLKQRDDVKSRMSPLKGNSLQNQEPMRNSSEEMKVGANQYCSSITPIAAKTKP